MRSAARAAVPGYYASPTIAYYVLVAGAKVKTR